MQATALVNEAYLRLMGPQGATWQDRAHFFAPAAQLMRHILVDHARAHKAAKRGGEQHQVTLTEGIVAEENKTIEVLALHEALERLARLDARQRAWWRCTSSAASRLPRSHMCSTPPSGR